MTENRPYIIALDISKRCTGVAMGYAGLRPQFINLTNKDGTEDEAAVEQLADWLIEQTKLMRPSVVYFEAPIERIPHEWDDKKGKVVPKGTAATVIVLAEMCSVVKYICRKRRIAWRTAHVASIRKTFLGHGLLKGPIAKQRARAMCSLLGWEVKNHDQADAAAVWHFATTQWSAKHSAIITPMMQAQAATMAERGEV